MKRGRRPAKGTPPGTPAAPAWSGIPPYEDGDDPPRVVLRMVIGDSAGGGADSGPAARRALSGIPRGRYLTRRNEFAISMAALFVSLVTIAASAYSIALESGRKRLEAFVFLETYLHAAAMNDARERLRESAEPASFRDPDVRRLLSSFDHAGELVRHGTVDRERFLEHWHVPLRIFGDRFEGLRGQTMEDGETVEWHYPDFFWLAGEAKDFRPER